MRITSGDIVKKGNTSVHIWISEQQKIIGKRSNHYGIHAAEPRYQGEIMGIAFVIASL